MEKKFKELTQKVEVDVGLRHQIETKGWLDIYTAPKDGKVIVSATKENPGQLILISYDDGFWYDNDNSPFATSELIGFHYLSLN